MLHLLQVGLGPLGRRVASDFLARELGTIVAAIDPGPGLVGRDLDELLPGEQGAGRGVKIRASPEEIQDWQAIRCAVVTTVSDLELCMETFRALLSRGVSVVSTCEELSWPWLRHPVLAQELHELAVKNRCRILGTGVNPGFLMDALPVAASTVCHEVRRVRVERVQDAAARRLPFQEKIGVGLDPIEFEARVREGVLRHVGLGESLHFVAHYLGLPIERWEETIEPVLAEVETPSGLGPVKPGGARGVEQRAVGWVASEPTIELLFRAAVGEQQTYDRIRIEGEPSFELVFPGGVHGDSATSAIVLNSIRPLLAAEPGLHTMASIPLQGRARSDDFASR